jgi:GNAT superfamily N-acetyltransferase
MEFALDVSNPSYKIPKSIRPLLTGKSEVKRYLAGDPVTSWISTLKDVRFTLNEKPIHPFLNGLTRLCHGSWIRTTVISGAIQGVERDPAATFFVFDDAGRIVGISVTSIDPDLPDELYREVTCTGIRRKGYGKQLDAAVVAYARELGKTRIRLEPADDKSREIHTAMGFREIDRTYMVKDVTGGRRTMRRNRKRSFLRKNKQWTRRH